MKRVLITGSSGEIGRALISVLMNDPEVELIAGLDLRAGRLVHPKLHSVQKNVTDSCLPELTRFAIDTVVHAAYTVEPTRQVTAARETASAGTRMVVQSAAKAGVQKFLHLSSATVYGARPGNPEGLAEQAAVHPNAGFAYAEDKAAAEAALRDAGAWQAFGSLLVLRPCFVLGPGTNNVLVRHLRRPLVVLPATQSALQFVHRDDLVRVMVYLLRAGISGTFNVGARGGLTATAMTRRLGGKPWLIPDRLLHTVHALAWRAHVALAPAPASALDLLRHPWRVDARALERVLPQAFRYTSEEAFESFAAAALLATRRRR